MSKTATAPPAYDDPSLDVDIIRAYEDKDHDDIIELVGGGVMEHLNHANNRLIFHPLTLILSVIIGIGMNFFIAIPLPVVPLFAPLVGPFLALFPVLAILELVQRPAFVAKKHRTLGAWDMLRPGDYYTFPSRYFIFERGGKDRRVVGALALDTRYAGLAMPSVNASEDVQIRDLTGAAPAPLRGIRAAKAALGAKYYKQDAKRAMFGIAEIRHLDVSPHARRAGVATHLLAAALDHAFGTAPPHTKLPSNVVHASPAEPTGIHRVVIMAKPFIPGGDAVLENVGFAHPFGPTAPLPGWRVPKPLGVVGATAHWMNIDKHDWLAVRDRVYAGLDKGTRKRG